MDVVEDYQRMMERFNRKRELHHRAHTLYKNRDMKVFTIPLMAVQLINAILPQISQAIPSHDKLFGIVASTLAAISAIWLGFQAKKRYAERSESHKNAASIYQHLAVLCMNEKQKAKVKNENDEQKFLAFQDMAQNLEGKAKDDENLVPVRIVKAYKREKDRDKKKGKIQSLKQKEAVNIEANIATGQTLPAITHVNGELPTENKTGPHITQYI